MLSLFDIAQITPLPSTHLFGNFFHFLQLQNVIFALFKLGENNPFDGRGWPFYIKLDQVYCA